MQREEIDYMSYNHRIATREQETALTVPQTSDAGLRVIVGTAPINLAADPSAAVNKPVLVNSFAEGVEALGYSSDFRSYTISELMDYTFRVKNVGPIICINVLDPAKHKKDLAESLTVTSNKATISEEGVMLSDLVVKNGETILEKGTDYVAAFNDAGGVDITLLKDGVSEISVSGTQLDPSQVTKEDIIGGYNASTGEEKGIEVIRQVYPKLGMVPGILLAPKWSSDATVCAALAAKCEELNGLFPCECAIDIDTTKAKKYTDLKETKEGMGITSAHAILCWPMGKLGDKAYDCSVVWATVAAATDADHGDVPYKSPSNEDTGLSAAVLADGTEVLLDIPQAETVNSYGIVTLMNDNGYKTWGNNTAAYPGVTDPKDRWIAVKRMFSWYRKHFILTYKAKVDDPISPRLTEAFVTSENMYLNSLTKAGSIAGGKLVYDPDENPVTNILNGHIIFHTYIGFFTPAEFIEDLVEFDPTILQTVLGG